MGPRQWDNMHQLVRRSWHIRQSWFDSSFFFPSSLFFLCCFVSTLFINFVQLLYCLIAFCIFIFFMWLKLGFWKSQWPSLWKTETRPKPTETEIPPKPMVSNHFSRFQLRISQTKIFSFGWPYTYKNDRTEPSTPLLTITPSSNL